MKDWIAYVLGLAHDNPDSVGILLGTLIGYVFTTMIERYFLPIALDPEVKRRMKGLTFVLCWLSSGTASSILWGALDPHSNANLRHEVCFTVSILSFAIYPVIAAYLTQKFPAIGSAWAIDPKDK